MVHALQAHDLVLALVLPVALRFTGHWLPEEPLMVAMGMVAARDAPAHAAALLALLWMSHVVTDFAVYSLGRVAAPRLDRWPRIARRVRPMAERIAGSRWALAALIPVRVFPVGRGAWLMGFGMAGVSRPRFAAADAVAVAVFLLVWCGLGWWVGPRAMPIIEAMKPATFWLLAGAGVTVGGVLAWLRYRS